MNDLIKRDLKYIWHPYTQTKDRKKIPPIVIDRARGMKLFAADGAIYYDTISSWWCNIHGHNHPAIKKAITQQLNKLEHVLFAGFTHKPAIMLAEKLIAVMPRGLNKVFYSDNGSTAVEVALKMSFQFWHNTENKKKKKFIALDHGYHGDTIGAMSVSGVSLFNEVFTSLFCDVDHLPSPYCYRCPFGKTLSLCSYECIEALEKKLKKEHPSIAALILEPMVLAAGGMIMYPADYLKAARALTKKYNIHLIADEVATGFGRTGTMFACEHAGITPDFMCLSKGITSGYLPLGVTVTKKIIFNAFSANYEKKKTFYHGHTYTANPLACAAAVASMDLFTTEKTLQHVNDLIPHFHQALEQFRALAIVGDVRRLGLIAALELVSDQKRKTPFGLTKRIGQAIYQAGLREGLLLRPLGDIIYFYLPLSITHKEMQHVLKKAFKVISSFS